MPNRYDQLRSEFSKKLEKVEERGKEAEEVGEKFPIPVVDELYYGITSYIKADKELSQGNEEGAITEMQKAVSHSCWAFFNVVKLHVLGLLRESLKARTLYLGHEDIAKQCIDEYTEHTQGLRGVTEYIRSIGFSTEKPEELQVVLLKDKIQKFLLAFSVSKGALVAAIKKAEKVSQTAQDTLQLKQKSVELEEETVRLRKETVRQGNEIIQLKKNQSWIRILSVGATVISAFVGIKSCVSDTSSQQTAQPEPSASEAELQSAENNSAL